MQFYQKIIDFLLPPQCALCQEVVTELYTLCSNCWQELEFITSPKCSICSIPLYDVDRDMPCQDCLQNPPLYTQAFAPLVYNKALKKLLLRFKNYDALHYAPMFSRWMIRCAPKDVDLILPVPLHWWRFFVRQYNQAAELAKLLEKSLHIPVEFCLLKRIRATSSQGHKTKRERYENLKSAFSVNDPKNFLKNATVLLVDDVLTSGATANACAHVLKNAGVKDVYVLTVARAVKNKGTYAEL